MPDSDDRTEPSTGSAPGVAQDAGASAGPSNPTSAPGPQVKAWADQLSDYVVEGVGWLKARTTVPVMTVLRVLVYGLVVVVALVVAIVLGVIGLVRIWDAYVPFEPGGPESVARLCGPGRPPVRRGRSSPSAAAYRQGLEVGCSSPGPVAGHRCRERPPGRAGTCGGGRNTNRRPLV